MGGGGGTATDAAPVKPPVDASKTTPGKTLQDESYKLQNGDLVFERTLHGLRNTVLLPAGWDVAAISQSGTIGVNQWRTFVALINLNGENNYRVTIQARKRE